MNTNSGFYNDDADAGAAPPARKPRKYIRKVIRQTYENRPRQIDERVARLERMMQKYEAEIEKYQRKAHEMNQKMKLAASQRLAVKRELSQLLALQK